MFRRPVSAVLICAALLLSAPNLALAYPFGGKASLVWPCFVFGVVPYGTISVVGSPNPGLYIWTLATRTYKNGPPAPGKWLLGLTSIPYICVVFPVGPIVVPGIAIGMMGSSGGGSPLNTFVPASPPPAQVSPAGLDPNSATLQNVQQTTLTPATGGQQD
ncbi:MAG: hypothetical protein Q7S01_03005 [bacterium]|nr:hypothetical protein [bacterium]